MAFQTKAAAICLSGSGFPFDAHQRPAGVLSVAVLPQGGLPPTRVVATSLRRLEPSVLVFCVSMYGCPIGQARRFASSGPE